MFSFFKLNMYISIFERFSNSPSFRKILHQDIFYILRSALTWLFLYLDEFYYELRRYLLSAVLHYCKMC